MGDIFNGMQNPGAADLDELPFVGQELNAPVVEARKAGFISLQNLFKGSKFVIPSYQRKYVWTTKKSKKAVQGQVEKLFDDISKIELGKPSFFGVIILVAKVTNYEVVDGQQRMSTLLILAAAIRDEIDCRIGNNRSVSPKLASFRDELQDLITGGSPQKFVVTTNTLSDPLQQLCFNFENNRVGLQNYIDTTSHNPSFKTANRLIKAFEYFRGQVENLLGAQLDQFVERFLQSVQFLVAIFDNQLDAFEAYESLNTKGLPLAVPDKVKNYLLKVGSKSGSLGHKLAALNHSWAQIEDMVDQLGEKYAGRFPDLECLLHFCIALYKEEWIQRTSTYDHITSRLQTPDQVQDFVNRLHGVATGLTELNSHFSSSGQWDVLGILANELNNEYSFLWVVSYLFQDGGATAAPQRITASKTICELAEKFAFRELVKGLEVSTYAREIFGHVFVSTLSGVPNKAWNLKQVSDSLANKVSNQSGQNFYHLLGEASFKSSNQGFYVSKKYEIARWNGVHVQGLNFVAQGTKTWHLEHIVPKKPQKFWGFTDEDMKNFDFLNRIGNLALISPDANKHIKNFCLGFKLRASKCTCTDGVIRHACNCDQTTHLHYDVSQFDAVKAIQTDFSNQVNAILGCSGSSFELAKEFVKSRSEAIAQYFAQQGTWDF